uniref:hypothetical protein n=1 Tax=Methylobacter psychrophilus TaxID=96941 RepID=UPI0021D4BB1F
SHVFPRQFYALLNKFLAIDVFMEKRNQLIFTWPSALQPFRIVERQVLWASMVKDSFMNQNPFIAVY